MCLCPGNTHTIACYREATSLPNITHIAIFCKGGHLQLPFHQQISFSYSLTQLGAQAATCLGPCSLRDHDCMHAIHRLPPSNQWKSNLKHS